EVVREGGVGLFGRARLAELSDEEAGPGVLRFLDGLEDGAELVRSGVLVASDLELDKRSVAGLRDLACTARIERRADVLNRRDLRKARHDVLDCGVEGRRAHANGSALDQDALIRRQLEPGIQDPVHAARLA